MGPVLAADSTTLQKLQIRLVRQSRGFEALARFPPCEMFSRDLPQFRIHDVDHPVQRFRTAIVPRRQHSGDIVVALCCHADRNPIKKDHLALTVPAPVRGIQSRNNFDWYLKSEKEDPDVENQSDYGSRTSVAGQPAEISELPRRCPGVNSSGRGGGTLFGPQRIHRNWTERTAAASTGVCHPAGYGD